MTRRAITLITAAVSLIAGTLVLSEHPASSPRDVSPHVDSGMSCRSCHVPFQPVVSDSCQACHGGLRGSAHSGKVECLSCHSEHRLAEVVPAAQLKTTCSTTCHHGGTSGSAIKDIGTHQLGKRIIERAVPISTAAVGNVTLEFSHRSHYQRAGVEQRGCAGCHVAEEARSPEGMSLTGCTAANCHASWSAAGIREMEGDAPAPLPVARLAEGRLERFRHAGGHVQTSDGAARPCLDCHVDIRTAGAVRAGDRSARNTLNCFVCHAQQSEDPSASGSVDAPPKGIQGAAEVVTSCSPCHEFHGTGAAGDFPTGPLDQAPKHWDVLARVGGLTITPWLLSFLAYGAIGFALVIRRLPVKRQEQPKNQPPPPEVPQLSQSYETSVRGLYIVGELAGVPLINRAMKSGFDVMDFIYARRKLDNPAAEDGVYDVLIAGAGPSGLGAATKAKELGLSHVVCEKWTPAATIKNFPNAKVVQAAPVEIPKYGSFFQQDDESKEGLVARWLEIIQVTGVDIRERQEVVAVESKGGIFVTRTAGGDTFRSRFVVLAMGVRGNPRRLKVPGEVPERVAYLMIDAAEFREQKILVVGGGKAACDVALSLSHPDLFNEVTLSHRGAILNVQDYVQAIDEAVREGRLTILPDSEVKEILPDKVILKSPNADLTVENDRVFAMLGAEPPAQLLQAMRIKLVRKGGL